MPARGVSSSNASSSASVPSRISLSTSPGLQRINQNVGSQHSVRECGNAQQPVPPMQRARTPLLQCWEHARTGVAQNGEAMEQRLYVIAATYTVAQVQPAHYCVTQLPDPSTAEPQACKIQCVGVVAICFLLPTRQCDCTLRDWQQPVHDQRKHLRRQVGASPWQSCALLVPGRALLSQETKVCCVYKEQPPARPRGKMHPPQSTGFTWIWMTRGHDGGNTCRACSSHRV